MKSPTAIICDTILPHAWQTWKSQDHWSWDSTKDRAQRAANRAARPRKPRQAGLSTAELSILRQAGLIN